MKVLVAICYHAECVPGGAALLRPVGKMRQTEGERAR